MFVVASVAHLRQQQQHRSSPLLICSLRGTPQTRFIIMVQTRTTNTTLKTEKKGQKGEITTQK
jgi:hypothetical protein